MLRKYETLYILKHDSAPEATDAAREKVLGIITDGGGLVIREDVWGKKKLAFEVKKHSKGIYILTTYLGEPDLIAELERNLRIHAEVIRYLTVKLADKVDVEGEKSEKERWETELAERAAREVERAEMAAKRALDEKARAEEKSNADDDDEDDEEEEDVAEEDEAVAEEDVAEEDEDVAEEDVAEEDEDVAEEDVDEEEEDVAEEDMDEEDVDEDKDDEEEEKPSED